MGWYGGQDGARRLRSRNAVADSFARFEASLGSSDNVEMKDFTNNLHDNRNYDVIKNILVDPTPQDSLIEQINASTKDKVAIAIAFSHSLQTFDDISDQICQRLQGLYLFGTVNVKKEDLLRFIRRCPSLKSLMLACVDDFAEPFLKTLFDETLLPKLEFLEVSNANNDAIAAMHTAPNLRKIVFRWPDPGISDAGFERLVANGGAKNLVAISGGVLQKDLSKSLSKSFLKSTLPKFVAGEAREHDLEHISVGKRVPKQEMQEKLKHAQQDSLPFAVIPPERMTFQQLREAFKNRGIHDFPPSIIKMRATLVEAGFTMEEEVAIQNAKHAEHLSETKLPSLEAAGREIHTKIQKIKRSSSEKLYPELIKHHMVSILKEKYGATVPSKWTRDDVANALHQREYQGGGNGTVRLTFLEQELARIQQEAFDANEKIESLQADANKYFHQKKAGKATAGNKRPLAHMN